MLRTQYMIHPSVASLGLIVAALAGCASLEAPETGARAPARALAADYPDLLTAEQISRVGRDAGVQDEALADEQAALEERLALLRARAAVLNGRVLTPDERARLED